MKGLLQIIAYATLNAACSGADYYAPTASRSTQIVSKAASDLTSMCTELWKYNSHQVKLPPEERYHVDRIESYLNDNDVTLKERVYYISFNSNKDAIELVLYTDRYTHMDYRDSWALYPTPRFYAGQDETVIGVALAITSRNTTITITDSGADGIGETNPVLAHWLPLKDCIKYNAENNTTIITPESPAWMRAQGNIAYAYALFAIREELEKKLEKLKK